MRLTISEGNSKVGRVPNISLPPGNSCVLGVPCFSDGCYAMKSYRMYPNVRQAWDRNLELWRCKPDQFIRDMSSYLYETRSSMFRWHVGGDIPDQRYLNMMAEVGRRHHSVSFLCFTKCYNLNYKGLPRNLVIVLSAWPGLDFEENSDLPTAWLAEDPRAPLDSLHIRCPGGCNDCGYQCWTGLAAGMSVIFDKH